MKNYKGKNSNRYTVNGIVDHVNKKYSFIRIDENSNDIKVRSRFMKGAIHGDKVEIKILQNFKRNLEGEIIKIIERKTNEFIGKIEDSKGFAFFIPNNKKIYVDFFIRKKKKNSLSKNKKYLRSEEHNV